MVKEGTAQISSIVEGLEECDCGSAFLTQFFVFEMLTPGTLVILGRVFGRCPVQACCLRRVSQAPNLRFLGAIKQLLETKLLRVPKRTSSVVTGNTFFFAKDTIRGLSVCQQNESLTGSQSGAPRLRWRHVCITS